MKKILYSIFLFCGVVLFAESEQKDVNATDSNVSKEEIVSATRGDIQVIEASEDIIYLSQKMVRDYLFLSINPENLKIKNGLDRSLIKLNDNLRMIARITKNIDTKDLLDYLAYSKDEIAEILEQKTGEEQSALMLDYSETLLEGANSMVNAHKYDFSEEEKMLIITKQIEYLLSRITKYYIALHIGFNNTENKEKMQESIIKLEENIEKINLYVYPSQIQEIQVKLNKSWKANKIFFNKSESLFLPNLIFNSIDYLEDIVAQLSLYHSKNQ